MYKEGDAPACAARQLDAAPHRRAHPETLDDRGRCRDEASRIEDDSGELSWTLLIVNPTCTSSGVR